MNEDFHCVIHGSFSKHFEEIKNVCEIFKSAGIKVLAPKDGDIIDFDKGFGIFEDEQGMDPRMIELLYLHNLKNLGTNGFSYFVNPDGYIGKSASYELGIAQLTNVPCFFKAKLTDHPAYIHRNSVWSAKSLADYIVSNDHLPTPRVYPKEQAIHKLWEDLMVPGSVVATGAIIEFQPKIHAVEKPILLVRTHKWGNRFSIVGGKVRRNEKLTEALVREVKEETRLKAEIGSHICTFDQLKNSGYYRSGVQHIFVDNVVRVKSKRVTLNEEAEDYVWALPSEALSDLDIEPNARATVELYYKALKSASAI